MVDPFTVEVWVAEPRFHNDHWIPVLPVPKADLADARRWLKAQGYQWTATRRWRIVDRNRQVVREFVQKDL